MTTPTWQRHEFDPAAPFGFPHDTYYTYEFAEVCVLRLTRIEGEWVVKGYAVDEESPIGVELFDVVMYGPQTLEEAMRGAWSTAYQWAFDIVAAMGKAVTTHVALSMLTPKGGETDG